MVVVVVVVVVEVVDEVVVVVAEGDTLVVVVDVVVVSEVQAEPTNMMTIINPTTIQAVTLFLYMVFSFIIFILLDANVSVLVYHSVSINRVPI